MLKVHTIQTTFQITAEQLTALLKCCGVFGCSRWAPPPASMLMMVMVVGSTEAESTATAGSPSTACRHISNDQQSQDESLETLTTARKDVAHAGLHGGAASRA